ncbi:gamma carbonic anhydrase family protein [Agaribacterium haliotis]|uniref:gamma carbonic anhydrase family protein n=1 Tax=Agaribacterium haliotis TaxID=2013869 RepID=UPI001EFD3102|nr:gamma carbonic anhydrase family protein [Agaribacterium haliotis]
MSNSPKVAAIRKYLSTEPKLGEAVFIDNSAVVIGDVEIGDHCSIWPCAVIRGDMNYIRIGARVSVQDNAVLHITHKSSYNPEGHPVIVGDDVTIGHGACLHGCTVGSRVLIGINSTVLDGAVVPDETVIAAGALVPPGKQLESGYLYVGSPAKKARPLTEKELSFFCYSAANYVELKDKYLAAEPEA